jgi:hypothetical protein
MIKTTLNAAGPILAAATMQEGAVSGIGAGTLGTALLIIMALAVILNQLWTLFDKARRAIRSPEADTAGLTTEPSCGLRRRDIGRTLDQLRKEDERQDAINKARFDSIDQSLKDMRREVRDDNKEVTHRLDTMTSAVGELIGRTKQ